jgi:hypothetical protein
MPYISQDIHLIPYCNVKRSILYAIVIEELTRWQMFTLFLKMNESWINNPLVKIYECKEIVINPCNGKMVVDGELINTNLTKISNQGGFIKMYTNV